MIREKACGECSGCKNGKGCEEHHRRCSEWPRIANTFHAGSVVTSVSSQFDLLTADLTKYEATLEALRDIDLEMEEDMDQLAPGSASRTNPRFSPAGRTRELEDERNHLARLAVLLQRHGELATRLQEVAEEDDEPQEVETVEEGGGVNPLTGTQTSRELIRMFGFGTEQGAETGTGRGTRNDGDDRLSTVEEVSTSPGGLSGGGWSLDERLASPTLLQPLVPDEVSAPRGGLRDGARSLCPCAAGGGGRCPSDSRDSGTAPQVARSLASTRPSRPSDTSFQSLLPVPLLLSRRDPECPASPTSRGLRTRSGASGDARSQTRVCQEPSRRRTSGPGRRTGGDSSWHLGYRRGEI